MICGNSENCESWISVERYWFKISDFGCSSPNIKTNTKKEYDTDKDKYMDKYKDTHKYKIKYKYKSQHKCLELEVM